ncbi:MAG: alpha-(1-_3)-arabinofuranosyltransferase family protein, partial [Ilumatobacteraceae bacterium]
MGVRRLEHYPGLQRRTPITSPILILLTVLPALVALYVIARFRFRNRVFYVTLLAAGLVASVGPGPAAHPQAYARLLRGLAAWEYPTPALVVGTRALPLVSLALAVALGVGVEMFIEEHPRRPGLVRVGSLALCAATVPTWWVGGALDAESTWTKVPEYWLRAAAVLNSPVHDGFAVLELPGLTVPLYEWGGTHDPISQSLVKRPLALRTPGLDQQPAIADLLAAIDDGLEAKGSDADTRLDPDAVAPLARMMGVDTILWRNDTEADNARAAEAWEVLTRAEGIADPLRFED